MAKKKREQERGEEREEERKRKRERKREGEEKKKSTAKKKEKRARHVRACTCRGSIFKGRRTVAQPRYHRGEVRSPFQAREGRYRLPGAACHWHKAAGRSVGSRQAGSSTVP